MMAHVGGELPRPDQVAPETPESFLDALGHALQEAEGADRGVADVLVAHILTATPAKNAVTSARDAILKLAEQRAAAPAAEAADG